MLRYIDTFTRYIWLWLIPIILIPVAISLFFVSNSTYTASGSLWVEQPIFSDPQSNLLQGSSYQTPSQQVASLLGELMNTREFTNGIIDITSLRNGIKTDADRTKVIETLTSKTTINGDKTRLLTINYSAPTTGSALETVDAIMTRFRAYYDERVNQQGEGALAYYQKLVDSTKADLDTATEAARTFIEDHPNQLGRNSGGAATTSLDLEYASLTQNLTNARSRYDDANTNLQKVLVNYNAYKEGQSTSLRVQDKPALLDTTVGLVRQIALGTGIGLAVGIALAILGTILITLFDGTIRYGFYARQVLIKNQVLELPEYKIVKPRKSKTGQPEPLLIKEGKAARRRRNSTEPTFLSGYINLIQGPADS